MRVFRLTVIVGILTLFVQCASVPLTGRKQVILLPESEMMQMSLTSYGDFLKENKLSTRTDDTRRVKEVGTRIAAAVEAYLKSQGLEKQIEGCVDINSGGFCPDPAEAIRVQKGIASSGLYPAIVIKINPKRSASNSCFREKGKITP